MMKKVVCFRGHMWLQSVRFRLTQIYILYFEFIKTTSGEWGKKNTDADTMCVGPWFSKYISIYDDCYMRILCTNTWPNLPALIPARWPLGG